jgi:hypothetical protein
MRSVKRNQAGVKRSACVAVNVGFESLVGDGNDVGERVLNAAAIPASEIFVVRRPSTLP